MLPKYGSHNLTVAIATNDLVDLCLYRYEWQYDEITLAYLKCS